MATVSFSDDAIAHVHSSNSHGGVYSTRDRSDRLVVEADDYDDEKGGLKRDSDLKKRQDFKGWTLLWLAYQSTGVIYGDIGTSPLYVYSSTFSSPPGYDDLLGALSLIIWALTLIVSVKYVVIVLFADDEGEGGTFAMYSLLSRYANIVKRDPKELSMVKFERHLSSEIGSSSRTLRSGIERSCFVKAMLKVIGVFGVSLVLSDGVLTPAQSVLGAIQGISVVNPSIGTPAIVGISCGILVLLFLIQPLGTSKIASAFAPIVIVWLLFNAIFGIYNLVEYDHSVLKAFSPYFAGAYLVHNQTEGWKSLGGILLAFTGCEALFADLGAFSRNSIRLSWLAFSYPCLLLAYTGQAAFLSLKPEAYSNPFFNCVPAGTYWPSQIVAVLAAIVASQAMITSSFQIMALSCFPQIKRVHTSKIFYGQIYIPMACWLMMIGSVIVTAVYNNTTSLGNAYGVCVILVTFITTCLTALIAIIVWRLSIFIVLPVFLVFAALDGAFLSAALVKVPQGAWFTLLLACLLSGIFILWRYGKENQWKAEAEDRFSPSKLVAQNANGKLALTPAFGGAELSQINGFVLFFDKAGELTPTVFLHFLTKFAAAPEVAVFFHLRPLPVPTVAPEERYTVTATAVPHCYRLVIRHGYTDEVISADLGGLVAEQVRAFIARGGAGGRAHGPPRDGAVTTAVDAALQATQASSTESSARDSKQAAGPASAMDEKARALAEEEDVAARLRLLDAAVARQTVYIVGKEQMRIRASAGWARRAALHAFLWLRENSRSKMAALRIPADQLVEVGFVKEV